MMGIPTMHEFMPDHIVDQGQRSLDDSSVQPDETILTAGSPARFVLGHLVAFWRGAK